jgi:hypothetical protein
MVPTHSNKFPSCLGNADWTDELSIFTRNEPKNLTIPGEEDIFQAKLARRRVERNSRTIRLINSLLSLQKFRVSETRETKGRRCTHRFATLPATCWLEEAMFDFGDVRGGARDDVNCSIVDTVTKIVQNVGMSCVASAEKLRCTRRWNQ